MNVAAELEISASPASQQRQAARAPLNVAGGLRKTASNAIGVTILDLSTHGFRADVPAPLLEGSVVWLKLPGLAAQQARVAWCEGLVVGCALTAPLHPAVFAHIVETLGRD